MQGDDPFPPDLGTVVGDLTSSLAFLTRLPARWLGVDPEARPDFRRAAGMLPLAGCLIGVAGGVVLIAATAIGVPPLVAAALAVAATFGLTGGLHEDGLADTADSYGGSTTERRLAIMDDSRVGAYGATALILSVVIRVACLAAIAATRRTLPPRPSSSSREGISRAMLVRLWHDLPAARMSGLAHETGPPDHTAMLVALATAGVLALIAIPVIGLRSAVLAAVFAALATYILTRMTAQAIGGRTGDTLGACQQVALAAYLIGAATL